MEAIPFLKETIIIGARLRKETKENRVNGSL